MIPVPRPKRPNGFLAQCTRRGEAWLKGHPLDAKGGGEEPRDYWSAFEPALRTAFSERCGWLAIWIHRGQVEHYRSKHPPDLKRRRTQRKLAYAWGNLRYADVSINLRKGNLDEAVLDPYEVGDGWFALNDALELEVTTACPGPEQARAAFTVVRAWPDSLATEEEESLQAQAEPLREAVTAGDAAVGERAKAQNTRRDFMARDKAKLVDGLNDLRTELHAELARKVVPQKLGRTWPDGFFRRGTSAKGEKSDEGEAAKGDEQRGGATAKGGEKSAPRPSTPAQPS